MTIAALLVFGVVGLGFAENAGAGRTVKIGYYSEPGMMNGAEPGVLKSGYAYEFIQEVANHAGWRYEYVYGRFDELYPKLKSGEIDLLPYVNYSERRASEILFPDMEMGAESFYLAAKKGGASDFSPEGLKGKKIGTSSGTFDRQALIKLMQAQKLDCTIVEFDSVPARWEALINGEIDYSIESGHMHQREEIRAAYALPGEYPYHFAVAPNRRDVLAELNEAQHALIHENPGFINALQYKYFNDVPLFKMLSGAGEKWLEAHPVIRIGSYVDQEPFLYREQDGTVVGTLPDCVKLMFSELGVTNAIEWKIFPGRTEGLAALKADDIDLIVPYYRGYADAEADGVIISAAISRTTFGVLFRGRYNAETLAVVATPGTRLGVRYMRDNYPNAKCIGCATGGECLERLLAGEVNSVVMYMPILQKVASDLEGEFNLKTLMSPCDICIAALPKNSALIGVVNKAVPYLKAVAVNEIANRHAIAESRHISDLQFFKKHPAYIYGTIIGLLVLFIIFIQYRRRVTDRYTRSLEQASKAKTDFLFSMSHDIRTPMNAILGFTGMAEKHLGDQHKIRDCLHKIQESGNFLLALINGALDVSRIEAGKAELQEDPGNVYLSFINIENAMKEFAATRDIRLTFEFGEITDKFVYADFQRCIRIFTNLISNAIKYSRAGGYVKVYCEQATAAKDGYASYRYIIEDNGIGMSEEFQRHMFENFTREQSSTISGIQGTGLGLAVCKAFVEYLKGTISCVSQKGQGTTFTVVLPFKLQSGRQYVDVRTGEIVTEGAEPTAKSEAQIDFAGKKVLLVEDNELNREIAVEVLANAGLVVEEAKDGSEAVETLKAKGAEYYDVVLMDIQMPIMNGYEATKAIREMYPKSKLPIIALSANAFAEDRRKSLDAGMNAHVAKPIKIKELFAALAQFV